MRTLFGCFLSLSLVGLPACSSVEPMANVRNLPPSALTIAVEAVPSVLLGESTDGLAFAASAAELRDMLVDALRAVNAASRVVPATEDNAAHADVTLNLSFREPVTMSHQGTSSYLAAGGLWLITWIGGLLVPDSSYNVKLAADCSLKFPRPRSIVRAVGSKAVSLSFFQRNDFLSWSTLQSLVLPPFWTTDQKDATSAALTKRSVDNLAEEIAAFLKQDFEERALETDFCRIELLEPTKNGAPVPGTSMLIEFAVIAKDEIKTISVAVNDEAPRPVTPTRSEQRQFDDYRAVVALELQGLRQDQDNWVRVVIETKEEFTRTLRFGPKRAE